MGIWPLDGSALHLIPGLDINYHVDGWSPDGRSVYVTSRRSEKVAKVYKVNTVTGKMDQWRTFGEDAGARFSSVSAPLFSSDGTAYVYRYGQLTSQAYLVTGLK
jgi:Tol biopolymer transport system component